MDHTASPALSPGTERALAAARNARALLAESFAEAPFTSLGDDDLIAMVTAAEEVGRLVDAARVGLAAQLMSRRSVAPGETELCVRYGCRTATDLLTWLTGISRREVTRRVRLGSALDGVHGLIGVSVSPLPEVAAALWQGQIGVDCAEAITTGLLPIRHRCDPAGFAAAERALLACATGQITEETADLPGAGLRFAADLIRDQVQVWAARLDPDGAAPDSPVMQPRSRIGFGRLKDGLYPIRGAVTPDLRGIMDTLFTSYLSARTRTRFPTEEQQHTTTAGDDVSDAGAGAGRDEKPPELGPHGHLADENDYPACQADTDMRTTDMRTTDEKRADILRGILDAAARHPDTPTIGGAPPTVTVHVNARDLNTGIGIGWIDGIDAPINLSTVRQMICAGGTRTILTGDNGQILHLTGKNMNSKQRCFTPAQRQAITARDGGCIIPGCTAPPQFTEVHHVTPWEHGGTTSINNGVLLCWFDHHQIDTSGWQIRMVDGSPQIKAPPWLDKTHTWHPARTHRANHPSRT
jgi:hypothetical protein